MSSVPTTTDRIRARIIPSQSIISLLCERQQGLGRTNRAFFNYRQFYKTIRPNLSIINVEKPQCYLRKFSLDGKYLIAFSYDQTRLEIYRYRGITAAMELTSGVTEEMVANFNMGLNLEIRSKIFNKLFKLEHVVETSREKQLNRECSLFTSDYRHVILGAASFIPDELRPNFYSLYTNNESITPTASSPLEDYTIYIIDLNTGLITDSHDFCVDKIILSHNQGLYLYENTLAVLSIQHQTIYIFHLEDGKLTLLRSIGRFCSHEEEFLYSSCPQNTCIRPFREPIINSLKHRILVFLYQDAKKREEAGDSTAIRRFYQLFESYKNLRMWKMQLIDGDHLLIKYSIEDVVTLKASDPNSHSAFFVFYNIWESKVLGFFDNKSEDLLWLYENFSDCFRNVHSIHNTSSPSNNFHMNLMHQRFKQTILVSKPNGMLEATKRLLAQLPISSQSYCSSPYLDMSLFSYDDKWVSALERPKACAEFPIRFFARDSGILKFRLHGNMSKLSNNSSRRLVAFSFHPTDPFIISVQRHNTEYIANFHIRGPSGIT
ncbi:DET1 homolog [Culicoides brevitarsis]|uniref:DET1 homolog n=1 Tax=Culicoides brevitarsis TaxID=469753 RepID=UPI00307BE173